MSSCPKCGEKVMGDFGMATCEACGNIFMLGEEEEGVNSFPATPVQSQELVSNLSFEPSLPKIDFQTYVNSEKTVSTPEHLINLEDENTSQPQFVAHTNEVAPDTLFYYNLEISEINTKADQLFLQTICQDIRMKLDSASLIKSIDYKGVLLVTNLTPIKTIFLVKALLGTKMKLHWSQHAYSSD